MSLALRDPEGSLRAEEVRAVIHEVLPGALIGVHPYRPFERTLGQPRFLATLLGALGVVTMALTVVGIFGIVNHEVGRRRREVAIRVACGAGGWRIRRFVLGRAVLPAIAGMAAGTVVSLWWTPALRSLLFGLEPNDLRTFLLAAALVLAAVLSACALPARRAARIDPVLALRQE